MLTQVQQEVTNLWPLRLLQIILFEAWMAQFILNLQFISYWIRKWNRNDDSLCQLRDCECR